MEVKLKLQHLDQLEILILLCHFFLQCCKIFLLDIFLLHVNELNCGV